MLQDKEMKKWVITPLIVIIPIIILCFQTSSSEAADPMVEGATAIWSYGLIPAQTNLTNTMDMVLAKPLIEYPDATSTFGLIECEGDLAVKSGETLPRPLVEYADTVITKALIFPEELFNPIPSQNIPPICSIIGNSLDGTVPLNVTFTMTASDPDGYITSWTLDIDNDGAPDYNGSGNPPSIWYHTYTEIGAYTAILTVTDNQSDTASDTTIITVTQPSLENQPPIANFTYSTDGCTVSFTDSSTDSDGDITSWYWDFGDQTYSTKSNPTHEYGEEGSYTVKLTVTDNDGETDTFTHTVTVEKDGDSSALPDFLMLLIVGIIIVIAAVIVYWVLKKRKET